MANQVVTFDTKKWKSFLSSVESKVKNPNAILKAAFSTRGFRDIIQHFDKERSPDGRWAPLTESTLMRRRKGRGAGRARILQDTGNLRRNFRTNNIRNKSKNAIEFFNPVPYAGQHDHGDSSKNLPQREFMYLTDKAQDDMLNIILDQVVK